MITDDQLDEWDRETNWVDNHLTFYPEEYDQEKVRKMAQAFSKTIQALRKEREDKKVLMEALEFYASVNSKSMDKRMMHMDCGDKASAALEKVK